MAVKDWSTTAGSNTGILAGLTLDGSIMTPPQVDNAFRDMAAQIASQLGKLGFKGADISSASPALSAATGWYLDITGTTTITAFGTVDAGQMFMLRFTGALLLTHNATSLILPGGASFTTAAGDVAFMMSLGSGNWRCISYQAAAAVSTVITPPTFQVFTSSVTWTKPTGCTRIVIEGVGGGGGSGAVNGQASGTGATGGGGSGFYGMTGFLDVSAVSSAAVTIGAAGAAGATPSGNGGNGGNTAITIGATTYTWGGGSGSLGLVASSSNAKPTMPGAGGVGTNVIGGSQAGTRGFFNNSDPVAESGWGGSSPLGTGGAGSHNITAGSGSAAAAGVGFGAGASGTIIVQSTGDGAGAAGTAGYMRIWEYYS